MASTDERGHVAGPCWCGVGRWGHEELTKTPEGLTTEQWASEVAGRSVDAALQFSPPLDAEGRDGAGGTWAVAESVEHDPDCLYGVEGSGGCNCTMGEITDALAEAGAARRALGAVLGEIGKAGIVARAERAAQRHGRDCPACGGAETAGDCGGMDDVFGSLAFLYGYARAKHRQDCGGMDDCEVCAELSKAAAIGEAQSD